MGKHVEISLVGQTIKQLRQSHHWTQDDLADAIGYSVRNLRRIENDGVYDVRIVNRIADIFNVSALDILGGCFFLFFKQDKPCPHTLKI